MREFLSEGKRAFELFELAISDFNLKEKFQKGVAVAFSGGADSVFLLLCMKELSEQFSFPLCAIHVNHHIRAEEAERDADFCRSFCAEKNIKFYLYEADVLELAKEKKLGIEEMARNIRYSFFRKFLDGNSEYQYIATAHNATDNAETVIFNMLRGGASRAMCGIPPVRDEILRPIIYISKCDIVDILTHNNIKYVFDSTNKDVKYSRNYIREEIIPKCSRINSSFESAIQRMNRSIRSDVSFIEKYVSEFCEDNKITFKAKKECLCNLDEAILTRVIIFMYENAVKAEDNSSLSATHIRKIAEIINQSENIGKEYCLPNGVTFLSGRETFEFVETLKKKKNEFCIKLEMGINHVPNTEDVIYLTEDKDDDKASEFTNVYKLSIQANLTFAKISGDIFIRNRKVGDAYRYGGMTHKVKRQYNDAKLSQEEKDRLPILFDDNGIIWIPGFPVRNDENLAASDKQPKNSKLYAYYYSNGGKDE